MKMRNKGKVHPFSSSSQNTDSLSVLQLLPAVILALVSVLSLEERQVLAYMITRSLKADKKSSKKQCYDSNGRKSPALFDCDCFHCYTSFWVRWDSSPNRELIHQAIEAFEEHLNNGEQLKKTPPCAGKSKRKDKACRARKVEKVGGDGDGGGVLDFPPVESPKNRVVVLPEIEVVPEEAKVVVEETAAPATVVRNHKGLARKVLPDVMGIFSSRLWSLWNPEV